MLHKTFCAKYLSDFFAVAHRNHGRHSTGTQIDVVSSVQKLQNPWCERSDSNIYF
jgi:hypothetical protein